MTRLVGACALTESGQGNTSKLQREKSGDGTETPRSNASPVMSNGLRIPPEPFQRSSRIDRPAQNERKRKKKNEIDQTPPDWGPPPPHTDKTRSFCVAV